MITLLPALLVICGRWVFWPVRPRPGAAEPAAGGRSVLVTALILDIGRWMWWPSRLAARRPERSVPTPVPATALR